MTDGIGTLKTSVAGQTFEVTVLANGQFQATFDDGLYSEASLGALRQKLDQAITTDRRANPVPFVNADNGRRGVVRGKHATRRVMLVTWDDGTKDDIATYQRVFRGDVDQEVVDEIRDLVAQNGEILARLTELRRDAVQADDLVND